MSSTITAAIIIITLSSFIIAKILKKFAKKACSYLLFAIADIFIGLLILGFAIYDFNTFNYRCHSMEHVTKKIKNKHHTEKAFNKE